MDWRSLDVAKQQAKLGTPTAEAEPPAARKGISSGDVRRTDTHAHAVPNTLTYRHTHTYPH